MNEVIVLSNSMKTTIRLPKLLARSAKLFIHCNLFNANGSDTTRIFKYYKEKRQIQFILEKLQQAMNMGKH